MVFPKPIVSRKTYTLALLRKFLAEVVPPDVSLAALSAGDLGNAQRVRDYAAAEAQRRYVHMYAAKSIGLWRAVRAQVGWDDRVPLVSVGAGPGLDLLGWCWDQPWLGPISFADPIAWVGVLEAPAWTFALAMQVGDLTDLGRRYVPEGPPPPQLSHIDGLATLSAAEIPEGSVVLLPFVANHLLDGGSPHQPSFRAFGDWVRAVRRRGCRIVVADMGKGPGGLWPAVLASLDFSSLSQAELRFRNEMEDLGAAYADSHAAHRTGQRYPAMGVARVLVIEDDRARFLTS